MIKESLNSQIQIGISEIADGNMRFFNGYGAEKDIIKNQEKLGRSLGLAGNRVARLKTIYNDRENFTEYQEITEDNLSKYSICNPEEEIPVSDGLVSRISETGLLLPLADCLGIVVYDQKQRILGLLHSGRHNVEQYGPQKFIQFLEKNFGSVPTDLKVYFSPCARNYHIFKLGNKKLPDAAREQLLNAGVLSENITDNGIDTVNNDKIPSCSSGDTFSRFGIVVKIHSKHH